MGALMKKSLVSTTVALCALSGWIVNVPSVSAARSASVTVIVSCSQDTEFYAKKGAIIEFVFGPGCTNTGSENIWNVSERDGSNEASTTGFLQLPKVELIDGDVEYLFTGRDFTPNDWYLYQNDYVSFSTKLLRSRKAAGVTYPLEPGDNVAGLQLEDGSVVNFWIIWKGPVEP
jgi:hypothetical protein